MFHRGKKVELLELFYDLVFVYAIGKMTDLIHHLHLGELSTLDYLQYLIICLVVLHAWLYQTVYINRFGRSRYAEQALVCLNMGAVLYLTSTIHREWYQTVRYFNNGLLLILATIILQFFWSLWKDKGHEKEKWSFIGLLSIEVALLLVSKFFSPNLEILFSLVAYLVALILPPFTLTHSLDVKKTEFNHLVERCGLLTIICFGEMLIHIAKDLRLNAIQIEPILLFCICVFLFGTYELQMDKRIKADQATRGLLLMYSHLVFLVSICSLTAWGSFIESGLAKPDFLFYFGSVNFLLFYVAIDMNSLYLAELHRIHWPERGLYLGIYAGMTTLAYFLRTDARSLLICDTVMCALIFLGKTIHFRKGKKRALLSRELK